MTIGIYKIYFSETPNKVYIGSSFNCEERRKAHLRTLRKGKHVNGYLQFAFNKYGEDKMVFDLLEIMEICSRKAIIERERFYYYQALDDGLTVYNAVVPMDRPVMTEELRMLLSRVHKGKPTWNKGIKTGLTPWNKGVPMSEETRKKCGIQNKGKVAWNKGMKMPAEHCQKLSEAHKGQVPWFKKRGVKPPKNTGRTWFKPKALTATT